MWGISCPHHIPQPRQGDVVSLSELFAAAAEPDEPAEQRRPACHRRSIPRHRRQQPSAWICLAEWVLGGWARTLRAATLMATTVIVVGAVAAALYGIYGVAAVAVVLALLHLIPEPDQRIVPE